MANKIVVVVRGGLVESIYSNDPELEVTLLDVDNMEAEEDLTNSQIDKIIESESKDLQPIIFWYTHPNSSDFAEFMGMSEIQVTENFIKDMERLEEPKTNLLQSEIFNRFQQA